MAQATSLLMLQFLAWIADRPRRYADVMEAWRSNCPRNPVWEDAVVEGLVRFRDGSRGTVILTPLGRAALDRGRPASAGEPPVGSEVPLASKPQAAIFRPSDEDVS
jgi:hypothetical protein